LKEKNEVVEFKSKHKRLIWHTTHYTSAASVACISQALALKEQLGAWIGGERGQDEMDGTG
jgi:hypothetical protein